METAVVAMNPLPAILTGVATAPAASSVGVTLVIDGEGFSRSNTVNVRACVVPPPGGGFVTETVTEPAFNSAAGMITVIEVAVAVAGECEFVPKLITDVALKLFPLRLRRSSEALAEICVGSMLIKTGTAFCG